MGTVEWLFTVAAVSMLGWCAARFKKHQLTFDRFTGGHSTSWLILGCSAAVTSISSDTPLLISGAFYHGGISENWFWLISAPGSLATLFFFARLWRRSGVTTSAEIISLRYGQQAPARLYRKLNAFIDAGIINVLVLASVTYSFVILLQFVIDRAALNLSLSSYQLAVLCTALIMVGVIFYTLMSGFKAVVQTDMLQFVVVLFVSFLLCGIAVINASAEHGGWLSLMDKIPDKDARFSLGQPDNLSFWLLLLFGWWYSVPGDGLFVQRLVSAKSEKDAFLTSLTFIGIHYVLRVWPWFLLGAIALVYFPGAENSESVYFPMATQFFPGGGLLLLLFAFVASFMSTLDSRLNWGASYFVHDIFPPRQPDAGPKNALIERSAVILLALLAFLIATANTSVSIIGIYKYILIIQAGTAVAAIARWYWWKMTIYAEIAAIVISITLGNLLYFSVDNSNGEMFAIILSSNIVVTGLLTLLVSHYTAGKQANSVTQAFQNKVQVSGIGWRLTDEPMPSPAAQVPFVMLVKLWLASIMLIYSLLAFIGACFSLHGYQLAVSLACLCCSLGYLRYHKTQLARIAFD